MEIQEQVVFRPDIDCFYDRVNSKRLKGITALAKRVFYPNYSHKKAKDDGQKSKKISGPQGMKRGRIVDNEISQTIYGKPPSEPHIFTQMAFQALKRKNLRPVHAQVVVFDGTLATAVDILCVDEENKPVLVEVKCSESANYTSSSGKMKGLLSSRDNSLYSQHVLQVQLTHRLFYKTYGCKAKCYIMQLNADGAKFIFVDTSENVDECLNAISHAQPKKRRKNAALKKPAVKRKKPAVKTKQPAKKRKI